eukprot:gnl/TRDRNA2_/TRDRNA2_170215_c1_seq1.p1 gnl/TRDRNA2_/TRDRNA2_170215_c1~~gnl/TRDRNA2_/TRDRNA2_170215_c1_seq1.p1  ORF type:complete len:240 (+),score=35.45 gnl/TRDRNA2_/TRDRNA2_170215_c1_seq1:69-788(+)
MRLYASLNHDIWRSSVFTALLSCTLLICLDARPGAGGAGMSEELRCDACAIVAQHIAGALMHSEHASGRPLHELGLAASLRKTCLALIQEYNTKMIGEDLRYSGPGTFGATMQGNMSRGWKASFLLKEACDSTMGALEQAELYALFSSHVLESKGESKTEIWDLASGVETFAQALCLRSEKGARKHIYEEAKTKRPKKEILGACSKELFYFRSVSFMEVLKVRHERNVHAESQHDDAEL